MTEHQYQRYRDLPEVKLPPHAAQAYLEDPKMLGIRLARYKFVAKMLAGKKYVAEIGCGDGFFSRVVEKEVRRLDLYDIDGSMCETHYVQVHDITKDGKLEYCPGDPSKHAYHAQYEAIYSLDCFEHIAPFHLDTALDNVYFSLYDDGVFILGMPSLESQEYASEASRAGHVSCMTEITLRNRLEERFENVFILGMNDETIHTGYGPMCHYRLAVCTGLR